MNDGAAIEWPRRSIFNKHLKSVGCALRIGGQKNA